MQNIWHKKEKGVFPNWSMCECNRTVMIPEKDVNAEIARIEAAESKKIENRMKYRKGTNDGI